MKLSDLMLTDEQRLKICGAALRGSCSDAAPCEGCNALDHERAAIANAVVVLDYHGISFYLPPKPKEKWNALLAECRKVVKGE